jgi:hypothetical protein
MSPQATALHTPNQSNCRVSMQASTRRVPGWVGSTLWYEYVVGVPNNVSNFTASAQIFVLHSHVVHYRAKNKIAQHKKHTKQTGMNV